LKAKPGHLKNREWLNLPQLEREKVLKLAAKRERERKAALIEAPALNWGK
jgi:acyl-CoA reductase-like NAD-dependent aldehyde dehydrogenase